MSRSLYNGSTNQVIFFGLNITAKCNCIIKKTKVFIVNKLKLSMLSMAVTAIFSVNAYAAPPVDSTKQTLVVPTKASVESIQSSNVSGPKVLTSAEEKNLQEINRLNMDVMLLEARLKKYESESKIAAKRSEISKLTPVVTSSGENSGAIYQLPKFSSIEGFKGVMYATIHFPNEAEIEVSEGDVLPNGMRVTKIAKGKVEVVHNKKTIRLSRLLNISSPSQMNGIPNPIGGAPQFVPPMN